MPGNGEKDAIVESYDDEQHNCKRFLIVRDFIVGSICWAKLFLWSYWIAIGIINYDELWIIGIGKMYNFKKL